MSGVGESYTCSMCGGVFEKTWSDDEAIGEYKSNFGQGGDEPPAIVCDDCYNKVMGIGKPEKQENERDS